MANFLTLVRGGRAASTQTQQLQQIARAARDSATQTKGLGPAAGGAVLKPFDDLAHQNELLEIDRGVVPVAIYASRFDKGAVQDFSELPMVIGERLISRDTLPDALRGAAELSAGQLRADTKLRSGPALAAIERGPGDFTVHQLFIETPHGRMALSLDEPVSLPIPKGATRDGAMITRTSPHLAGMASSSGVASGFGKHADDAGAMSDELGIFPDLTATMRQLRASASW